MKSIEHKSYLIVGGTSGIGLQIAQDLCSEGEKVVIVGSNEKKAKKALYQLSSDSDSIVCDLREPKNVEEIYNYSKMNNIPFDGLVYCAGISPLMLVSENDRCIMQDAFAINCMSFIECAKYFSKNDMHKQKGSIVVLSSIAATQSTNRQTVYAGTKAALEAAVRCMGKEFLLKHIRVNAIALGAVRTEMFEKIEKSTTEIENRYPLGVIPMKQVSQLARYLLSDDSDYITGSIMKMDSGHDVWMR